MFRSALLAAVIWTVATTAIADPPPLGATEVSAALQAIGHRCPADLTRANAPTIQAMNGFARASNAAPLSDDQSTHLGAVEAYRALLAQDPQLDEHELARAGVTGMADAFEHVPNPDAFYVDTSQCDCSAGVGLEIRIDSNQSLVVRPLPGTPAERSGIIIGDRIVAIDSASTTGWTLNRTVRALNGPLQSPIALTLKRDGVVNPIELHLQRERIVVHAIDARLEGDIGVISMHSISENAGVQIRSAIRQLRGLSAGGYVLDLRANPGGLLDQAIEVADVFLDGGLVTSVEDHGCPPIPTADYHARRGDDTRGAPVVVLIDHDTASGGELIAGALMDRGRAVSVGQHSFSNGLVQTFIPLSRRAGLKLATGDLLTPARHRIGDGIEPTYPVPVSTPGHDFALERALEILQVAPPQAR